MLRKPKQDFYRRARPEKVLGEVLARALQIPSRLLPAPSVVMVRISSDAAFLGTHAAYTLYAILSGFRGPGPGDPCLSGDFLPGRSEIPTEPFLHVGAPDDPSGSHGPDGSIPEGKGGPGIGQGHGRGRPITEAFAREIGAYGYAPDAGTAVERAKQLLGPG